MGDNALLNSLLRIYFAPSNFNLLNPAAPNPVEIDHFFEVQHVVDIIVPVLGGNWYTVPVGEFLDLSTFVNDHRNLFKIRQVDNQNKKTIPLNQYPTNAFIAAYLGTAVQGGGTVRDSVRALARAMRDRVSPYNRLTRVVGAQLCHVMGW
jgi:hypothetical protein